MIATKYEPIAQLIDAARTFRFCGPSDDPDKQTAVTAGYHYLVTQLKRRAGHLLPEAEQLRLNSIEVEIDNIYSVYEARAEIDALLPDIENALQRSEGADLTIRKNPFIDVGWTPDDFYEKLIDEINRACAYQMPIALSVTIRKLLENLVIDILRKKYSTAQLELYYDPSRGRFNDFSVLLQNLDAKRGDFRHISASLNKSFIKDLNRYRETGNSGAHSIDTKLTVEQFVAEKEKINYIVQLLLRVFRQL
jgi:hypothetical protein